LITSGVFGTDRETVRQALEKENIESRPVWKPMHKQPVFKGSTIRGGRICEDLFERGLCLPSGTAMTENDLKKVVQIIRQYAKR
jgi:dTDP-4-amino-4,6-dideoxygalactose transaminase